MNLRLPKELIIYIYSFDSTYKEYYNKCICELSNYFFKNRLKCRLEHDLFLFNNFRINSFSHYYYGYILNRIKMYGDNIENHNLNHLLIINNKIIIRN